MVSTRINAQHDGNRDAAAESLHRKSMLHMAIEMNRRTKAHTSGWVCTGLPRRPARRLRSWLGYSSVQGCNLVATTIAWRFVALTRLPLANGQGAQVRLDAQSVLSKEALQR